MQASTESLPEVTSIPFLGYLALVAGLPAPKGTTGTRAGWIHSGSTGVSPHKEKRGRSHFGPVFISEKWYREWDLNP